MDQADPIPPTWPATTSLRAKTLNSLLAGIIMPPSSHLQDIIRNCQLGMC